ncbi:MAG: hypothetical protein ACXW1W_00560 [Methylococcaceae bacterium]
MSNSKSSLDDWLSDLSSPSIVDQGFWDPGFDGERRVVFSKLGPYQKLFERPQYFMPRFFHHIYPLLIEDWFLTTKTTLYGGFCTMATDLRIIFQPTFNYAKRNIEVLPRLNQHIKTNYEGVIKDIVSAELRNLDDGGWVQTGLGSMERQIETVINEALVLRHIQCRSICVLKPAFEELTDHTKLDDRFTQSVIYLSVLKKNFEFREQKNSELFRQEEELELQRLAHKQKQLETINQEDEILRKKLALEAEAAKRQLEEQERQRTARYVIESRLHEEKVIHDTHLKEIEQAKEEQFKKEQQILQQQIELQMQARQFEHELLLKQNEREAELKKFEQHRLQLLQTKEHEQYLKQLEIEAALKEQEFLQVEQQKTWERLEAEKINHQSRLTEMQLEAEIKALELRTEATQNKDKYLRREIEWLVLDKQRAELTRAIKEANQDIDDFNRKKDI